MNTQPVTLDKFGVLFTNIVHALQAIALFAFFVLLVVGGFKYLTSGGDPKAAESAKKTITYAIGGFVIFAFSYIILKIVGDFTGTQSIITNFNVVR